MGAISCAKIQEESELRELSCGEPAIDNMIHASYYPHLLRQQDTYCIKYEGKVIGTYALTVKAIDFVSSDKEIAGYFEKEPVFGVLFIKYLAVDKKLQGKGVGTTALQYIVRFALNISQELPIRCVVFEALREKIDFYKKCGFVALSEKELYSESETVSMFMDLMPGFERERIENELNLV